MLPNSTLHRTLTPSDQLLAQEQKGVPASTGYLSPLGVAATATYFPAKPMAEDKGKDVADRPIVTVTDLPGSPTALSSPSSSRKPSTSADPPGAQEAVPQPAAGYFRLYRC